MAAPGVASIPAVAGAVLASDDPRLAATLNAAEQEWASADGKPSLAITLIAQPLPAGVLGESYVTDWDSNHRPAAATIIVSPDAAGAGWYIEPIRGDNGTFASAPNSTTLLARPGSAADGHYDLLTVLEHEVGHVIGFDPDNPGYATHLEMIGGSPYFVAPGFSAPVGPGGELDPNRYPDDVMAATLAPGVRKVPSPLEMDVISTLWGTSSTSLAPSQVHTFQVTAPNASISPNVVDHAVAAMGDATSRSAQWLASSLAAITPVTAQPPAEQVDHQPIVRTKHRGAVRFQRPASHKFVAPAKHKRGDTPGLQTPNAGLARGFALHPRVAQLSHGPVHRVRKA
jgi:hypothetical protein